MAVVLLLFSSTTPSLSSLPPPTPAISVTHLLKVQNRFVKPNLITELKFRSPFALKQRGSVIVKAASDTDGTGTDSEAKEQAVPVENLPLKSKLQLKQEQHLKTILAKKIRLRRKRLVRKRRLRKKGRWPPSNMKKNKNV